MTAPTYAFDIDGHTVEVKEEKEQMTCEKFAELVTRDNKDFSLKLVMTTYEVVEVGRK